MLTIVLNSLSEEFLNLISRQIASHSISDKTTKMSINLYAVRISCKHKEIIYRHILSWDLPDCRLKCRILFHKAIDILVCIYLKLPKHLQIAKECISFQNSAFRTGSLAIIDGLSKRFRRVPFQTSSQFSNCNLTIRGKSMRVIGSTRNSDQVTKPVNQRTDN